MLLRSEEMFRKMRDAEVINKKTIAEFCRLQEEDVLSIKATIVRPLPSGALGERDVYGAQQHAPWPITALIGSAAVRIERNRAVRENHIS